MYVSTLPSPHSQFLASGAFCKVSTEKAVLFRRKTILKRSLSVRHPKGARSIGMGHPRSGDRCTETRPYPRDPLRVAEQKSPLPTIPQGCRTYQSGNECDALAGSQDCMCCLVHRSRGAAPRPVATKRAPRQGCFIPHSSLLDEWLM